MLVEDRMLDIALSARGAEYGSVRVSDIMQTRKEIAAGCQHDSTVCRMRLDAVHLTLVTLRIGSSREAADVPRGVAGQRCEQ